MFRSFVVYALRTIKTRRSGEWIAADIERAQSLRVGTGPSVEVKRDYFSNASIL